MMPNIFIGDTVRLIVDISEDEPGYPLVGDTGTVMRVYPEDDAYLVDWGDDFGEIEVFGEEIEYVYVPGK